eukprot:6947165-Karenia_brevis.AAC.1
MATARERTLLHDLPTVDIDVFRAALLPDEPDNKHHNNIINMISTLSAVDKGSLHRFRAVDNDICPFCHLVASSVHHCIWKCSHPALKQARDNITDDMERLIIDHVDCLPTPLLYGLPPKLALLPCGPWWDNAVIS